MRDAPPAHVKLAVAPIWKDDLPLLKMFYLGLLRRAGREDFQIEFILTSDYGVIGLVDCDPPSRDIVTIAANQMQPALEFRIESDPVAALRKMSAEDQQESARIDTLIEDYLREIHEKRLT